MPQLETGKNVFLAVSSCGVSLLPKLLFAYFMLYIVLEKYVKKYGNIKRGIYYTVLALIGSLFFYRVLEIYFTDPLIYGWHSGIPVFFDLFGFLVALMDIGFAAGAAIAVKLVRLQIASKEREKNLVKEKLEAELKFLRNQTNPHFLFNTLNNIYALALKKSDDTPKVVMKLSKLLRFMLYDTGKPLLKIDDEIKMIEDYIELEKIRYNEKLNINFEKDIDDPSGRITPLLLLPFVENAFKHGASESRFISSIFIHLQLKNNILDFKIRNTTEYSKENNINENIGLANIKRQLEISYKDYKMHISNEENYFVVQLIVNLKSYAKI